MFAFALKTFDAAKTAKAQRKSDGKIVDERPTPVKRGAERHLNFNPGRVAEVRAPRPPAGDALRASGANRNTPMAMVIALYITCCTLALLALFLARRRFRFSAIYVSGLALCFGVTFGWVAVVTCILPVV